MPAKPRSPHFSAVELEGAFNAERAQLPHELRTPANFAETFGEQTIRGMPFAFGTRERPNVVWLERDPVTIELDAATASYALFVHAVQDAPAGSAIRFAGDDTPGRLGGLVSEYVLEYADGSTHVAPVLRGFSIQQARMTGGLALSVAWACVPALDDTPLPTAAEAVALGHSRFAAAATRVSRMFSGEVARSPDPGLLWLGAVATPRPEAPLSAIVCRPRAESSALYALTLGTVSEHPLRPGTRRKLRLRLPDEIELNAIGEVDPDDVAIDLGVVISARAALDYEHERWVGDEPLVQPSPADREVIVEYAAHPQARLHLGSQAFELAELGTEPIAIAPAERPVRLRFVERGSSAGVAVRLHLHGAAGEYLPPRGHHRKVNAGWHEDTDAEFASGANQYAYVDGECIVDLPLGTVYIEIARGYEIAPVRATFTVGAETDELVFELERVLRWRERGWVTADTHVHFLSPQTALLEGRAEGVNVVNLLASQWGEMFTNVGDFDGRTTFGADGGDGRGEFLVRVGSENRGPVLGHISLLGYGGELIHPLCSGGPGESAFGDPLEVTLAEWAQRCLDQGGLVVLPHMANLQLEHAADVVLGLAGAFELQHADPLQRALRLPGGGEYQLPPPLAPYALMDWYRYLSLGYHIPLVGGSDKMSAMMLLGGVRTYARLGDEQLSYDAWMDAVRAGNTFVTVGPLVELSVEGIAPGGQLRLPAGGGSVEVEWRVESLRVPLERIELVVEGLVVDDASAGGELSARGRFVAHVGSSTWVALRVRGSYHGLADDIAAHTSAVQVLVEGSELFSAMDSMAVLDQIQGALAYVDTLAPRAEARRLRQLRATLETAYTRLHERMHAAGVYHTHLLHDSAEPHEH